MHFRKQLALFRGSRHYNVATFSIFRITPYPSSSLNFSVDDRRRFISFRAPGYEFIFCNYKLRTLTEFVVQGDPITFVAAAAIHAGVHALVVNLSVYFWTTNSQRYTTKLFHILHFASTRFGVRFKAFLPIYRELLATEEGGRTLLSGQTGASPARALPVGRRQPAQPPATCQRRTPDPRRTRRRRMLAVGPR